MRVGLAAYLLHGGADYRAAGVSRYAQCLAARLPLVCPQHEYILFHGADAPPVENLRSVVSPVPTVLPVIRLVWEQTGLPVQAARAHVDLLHGTVNVVPVMSGKPVVVTVHDLSFIRFRDRFPVAKAAYLRAAVALSTRRAAVVIAVSEATRRDLIELLGVPEDRVIVVPEAAAEIFRRLPREDVRSFRAGVFGGRPYILHVGTLQPRKNLDILIRAYAELRRGRGLPHVLALVGARGWMYDNLFALVRDEGLEEDVRFIDFVDPGDLPLWYNACDLFAYPSAYEGFGLPVLEAMACGVPVITSALGALEELAGDACLTISPGSQEALQLALLRVLEDTRLRADLALRGPARAAMFTWDRTARETAGVYERAFAVSGR
jgi:glycosyltransferase involved in cell wall biosynthesis